MAKWKDVFPVRAFGLLYSFKLMMMSEHWHWGKVWNLLCGKTGKSKEILKNLRQCIAKRTFICIHQDEMNDGERTRKHCSENCMLKERNEFSFSFIPFIWNLMHILTIIFAIYLMISTITSIITYSFEWKISSLPYFI